MTFRYCALCEYENLDGRCHPCHACKCRTANGEDYPYFTEKNLGEGAQTYIEKEFKLQRENYKGKIASCKAVILAKGNEISAYENRLNQLENDWQIVQKALKG